MELLWWVGLAGALPTAAVAYLLAYVVSRRFGLAARALLILLGPAVWIIVSSVLRSAFPAEPGCTDECYGDLVYVGVMFGGVLGTWLAVLVSWAFGRVPPGDPTEV
jgi:uncharacterized membrane protein YedE/YeeE